MKYKSYKKGLVFGIIILLITTCITPTIGGKTDDIKYDKESPDKSSVVSDTAIVSFHTFDKTIEKQKKDVVIPADAAKEIQDMLEKLKQKISYEPMSDETQALKTEIVNLLDNYDLIPNGLSKNYVLSLLNPSWLNNKQKTPRVKPVFPVLRNFISRILNVFTNLQQFFKTRFGKTTSQDIFRDIAPVKPYGETASATFCYISSAGLGTIIPFFLPPRPRGFAMWYSLGSLTSIFKLLTGKSFNAMGMQTGLALGFMGFGLTYMFPGYPPLYGFVGYSLFASVTADDIEYINHIPIISNEKPYDGNMNVPVSLSELSFRLTDGDGDLMSYSVTTSPNIGSGSGNNKGNGVYSVPASGLDGNTDYTWYVSVNDGYDIVEKTFTFKTEAIAPVITNPSPSDGSIDIPLSLSEISFHLKDYQGDLMDYTVTTQPDIGSGSGNGVGDGTYTVPVSGLDYLTDYTWYVTATDGEHQANKVYSFQTAPIMIFDPFDMGWQYRKQITIDHAMVDGDLTSFPILISTTDTDLRDKAQSDGDDILFMDGPGVATRLYHEIEYYEDSNGELVAWVNIPSLSSNIDIDLYMYYGNPSCSSQQFPERIWDSNYVAVYHLGGSSYSDIDDSTSNDLDVVDYQGNPVYQQTGKVGFCVDFDDDSLNVADNDLLSFTDGSGHDKPMTVEAWVKYDSPNDGLHGPIVSKYAHGKSEWLFFKIGATDHGRLYFFDQSTEAAVARKTESSLNVDNTGWNYISGSYIGNEEDTGISFVLDGVVEEGEQHGGWAYEGMHNLGQPMRIGAYHSNNINQWFYWQGLIDEVRLSNVARSSSWLITSYNTMNDPSSFYIIGPEEAAP